MLPQHEWLPHAKALAVGMKNRIIHRNERRPNLVVGNAHDRFWAYCQACREGAVLEKDHVRLDLADVELPSQLERPLDARPVHGSDHTVAVAHFLATKGMDLSTHFPPGGPAELLLSRRTGRLVVAIPGQGWMGRDMTERSPRKWLTYDRQHFLHIKGRSSIAVVTEDTFSAIKVHHATGGQANTYCSLGTGQHQSLLVALLEYYAVVFMYDGDAPGRDGARLGVSKMRAIGRKALAWCAPEGLDPKDMTIPSIITHMEAACRTLAQESN